MKLEKALPRAASVIAVTSFTSCWAFEETRHRRPFLGLFVDHDSGADSAIRVAAARERAPLGIGPVN